ncbi:MAG: hypothetical protein IPQ07_20920 [Myxococcales bacterium]|nr:hypothetical protein [Myxococcales bacterium]
MHDEIGKRAALKVVHRSLLTPAFNVERVLLEAKVERGRPPQHRRHLRDRDLALMDDRTS